MNIIQSYLVCTITKFILPLIFICTQGVTSSIEESFNRYGVVPDVIPIAPARPLSVVYPNDVEVNEGNQLSPLKVVLEPQVTWDADPSAYYTLAMVDPDVPSRDLPALREFDHWLVGNIPGYDVEAGDELAAYVSPTPPPATGLHRYVFLVYLQDGIIDFDGLFSVNRTNFSVSNFAMRYNLGRPVFGNFFQSQSTPSVI